MITLGSASIDRGPLCKVRICCLEAVERMHVSFTACGVRARGDVGAYGSDKYMWEGQAVITGNDEQMRNIE